LDLERTKWALEFCLFQFLFFCIFVFGYLFYIKLTTLSFSVHVKLLYHIISYRITIDSDIFH